MEMVNGYKKVVFENYAKFSGRARRSEFWYFVLFNTLIFLVFGTIEIIGIFRLIRGYEDVLIPISIIYNLYLVAMIIPSLAVSVRRLHDIGKNGWYLLVGLFPLIGTLIIIDFFSKAGDLGENQYGANPKKSEGPTEFNI